ncbi:MAG: transmembrane anchor protein [Gemmatimonadaceae bacterium]
MTTIEPLSSTGAPSSRQLLRSTAIALGIAIAILVAIVLPAEYGVDPTGVGRVLGLKEMGETKLALAKEAAGHDEEGVVAVQPSTDVPAAPGAAAPAPSAGIASDSVGKSDVTEITLAANEGKEIKLVMRKGAVVTFSWATIGGVVNYDTHGDSPTLKYHGYGKGTKATTDEGILTAAFDGHHGWFWRNKSAEPVVVTLKTKGDYQELMRMP